MLLAWGIALAACWPPPSDPFSCDDLPSDDFWGEAWLLEDGEVRVRVSWSDRVYPDVDATTVIGGQLTRVETPITSGKDLYIDLDPGAEALELRIPVICRWAPDDSEFDGSLGVVIDLSLLMEQEGYSLHFTRVDDDG